jgi:hypothetical protein
MNPFRLSYPISSILFFFIASRSHTNGSPVLCKALHKFFKWIKQHLRIKTLWGTSPNAVKTQIWIAVCTYLLIAYAKNQLKSGLTLYEITQILSVSAFDKTPINELLTNF